MVKGKRPFDHWLHKQLHELYDSITKEPLPDDLVKLIDNDARPALKPAPARCQSCALT
ncbi:MAG: hypothetical protein Q8M19_25310 [Reyranella sp.]|nr:hypothetical protein [Reyranella sp.]